AVAFIPSPASSCRWANLAPKPHCRWGANTDLVYPSRQYGMAVFLDLSRQQVSKYARSCLISFCLHPTNCRSERSRLLECSVFAKKVLTAKPICCTVFDIGKVDPSRVAVHTG